jgi:hypothetical protein
MPRGVDGLADVLPFNRRAPTDVREHYARLDHWTLDEAAALSLGLNPEWCDWSQIDKFVAFDATAKRYARLRLALQRSIEAKTLKSPLRPQAVLRWATFHLDVPPELKVVVDQFANRRGVRAEPSEEETGVPLRKTLLSMIAILMCLHHPESDISKKGGWLADKARPFGIKGHEETFRAALRECAEALADLPDRGG